MGNSGRACVSALALLVLVLHVEPTDAAETFELARLIDAETGVPIDEGWVALVGPGSPLKVEVERGGVSPESLRRFEGPVADVDSDGGFQFPEAMPGPEDSLFIVLADGAWWWVDHAREILIDGSTIPVPMPGSMVGERRGRSGVEDRDGVVIQYLPPTQPHPWRWDSVGDVEGPLRISFTTSFDSDGRFVATPLAPGRYLVQRTRVFAGVGQEVTLQKTFDFAVRSVAAGGTTPLAFGRNRGTMFEGQVLDPTGEPVVGALVTFTDDAERFGPIDAARTDHEGRYEFRDVAAGGYSLNADVFDERLRMGYTAGGILVSPDAAAGSTAATADPLVIPDTDGGGNVRRELTPAGGRCRDVDVSVSFAGWDIRPERVSVRVVQWNEDRQPFASSRHIATEDDPVRFALDDRAKRVTFRILNVVRQWRGERAFAPEDFETSPTWEVPPPCRIRGVVTRVGRPISGPVSSLWVKAGGSGEEQRLEVDDAGRYSLAVGPNLYFVYAKPGQDGMLPQVTTTSSLSTDFHYLTAGDEVTVDFDLVPTKTVSKRFVRPDGTTPDEPVTVYSYGLTFVSDEAGRVDGLVIASEGLVPLHVVADGKRLPQFYVQSDFDGDHPLVIEPNAIRPPAVDRSVLEPVAVGSFRSPSPGDAAYVVRLWHPHDRNWLAERLSLRPEDDTPVLAMGWDRDRMIKDAGSLSGLEPGRLFAAGPGGERLPDEVRFGVSPTRVVFE